jgi:hypothetical protein
VFCESLARRDLAGELGRMRMPSLQAFPALRRGRVVDELFRGDAMGQSAEPGTWFADGGFDR